MKRTNTSGCKALPLQCTHPGHAQMCNSMKRWRPRGDEFLRHAREFRVKHSSHTFTIEEISRYFYVLCVKRKMARCGT